jgi:hypothetical protein
MKALLLTLITSLCICISISNNILAQSTAIPDTSFEAKLIQLGIDSDGLVNGQLLNSDAALITYLPISSSQISNLTGIEAFINLDTLECIFNNLTTLNLGNNPNLTKLTCYDNNLVSLDISQNSNLFFLLAINNPPSLEICVPSVPIAQANSNWIKDASATYIEGCRYSLGIEGDIAIDLNANCLVDANESKLPSTLLLFDNGVDSIYISTDSSGHYKAFLDTGTYNIALLPSNPYSSFCSATQQVTILPNPTAQTIDFVLQNNTLCPYLEIDINAPFLRRCFPSNYYVHYCNTGTAMANNAYVEIELDSTLAFNSSSIPLISQVGNVYRFNVGSLNMDTCGSFSINVTASCFSILGQIHCVTAHIYPDSLCLSTLPNIHIADTCLTDTVLFVLTNYGAAFPGALSYLIVEDSAVVDTGSIFLGTGQSISILYPASGNNRYQLVLGLENPTYYTVSGLTGCTSSLVGTNLLYLPNTPQDFVDIDCRSNIGSFDPNDKTGYPLGFSSNHYIAPNTPLDYLIRFQNTGTDTAIFINILDTLSSSLDISTLQIEGASHPYTWELMPNTPAHLNVLRFTFDPIYLPDSTVNEPASNGFIKYRVAQKKNLTNGTLIQNSASIYFDFNAPVKTNTTVHTVCDNCIPQAISGASVIITATNQLETNYEAIVRPNPFKTSAQIQLLNYENSTQDLKLEIYDLMGRLQTTVPSNAEATFTVNGTDLTSGIYFFRITNGKKHLQTGRFIVQ